MGRVMDDAQLAAHQAQHKQGSRRGVFAPVMMLRAAGIKEGARIVVEANQARQRINPARRIQAGSGQGFDFAQQLLSWSEPRRVELQLELQQFGRKRTRYNAVADLSKLL
jgi:hypothetical protein